MRLRREFVCRRHDVGHGLVSPDIYYHSLERGSNKKIEFKGSVENNAAINAHLLAVLERVALNGTTLSSFEFS